jgi:hypothetical protein
MTHSHSYPQGTSPRPGPGTGEDTPEHSLEWYARETARSAARTAQAVQFIAWVVGLSVLASVVFAIIVGVNLAHIADQVSQTAANTVP